MGGRQSLVTYFFVEFELWHGLVDLVHTEVLKEQEACGQEKGEEVRNRDPGRFKLLLCCDFCKRKTAESLKH